MSEKLKEEVIAEFKKHGSIFKTARRLGIDNVDFVADAVKGVEVDDTPDTSTCEFEGFGDPNKRQYLVARGLATEVWDNSLPEIAEAREKFEAGTHEMATGRDGPWVLLYLFPRVVKQPRPGYFTQITEAQ